MMSQRIIVLSMRVSAICVALTGLVTIIGHAIGIERMHRWTGSVGMAVNTAITLMALAFNWYILSYLLCDIFAILKELHERLERIAHRG